MGSQFLCWRIDNQFIPAISVPDHSMDLRRTLIESSYIGGDDVEQSWRGLLVCLQPLENCGHM